MSFSRESPCKVNLILNILGKRPDGFHEVETVLQPIPICDTLNFEHAGGGIGLTCSDPTLPTDRGNLIWRAAEAFLTHAKLDAGVRIHLEKRLPIAAGIGGGSANAACTLLALQELFSSPLDAPSLTAIAASLGADVPFFLQDNPALGIGKGEQVKPLERFPALRGKWIVLVHPGFGISTPWAYKELARFPKDLNGEPGRARRLIAALQTGSFANALPDFYNSLEAPALEKYPLLTLYQRFFKENGALVALMSGSGSSTFSIFEDEASAREVEARFRAHFGKTPWIGVAPL